MFAISPSLLVQFGIWYICIVKQHSSSIVHFVSFIYTRYQSSPEAKKTDWKETRLMRLMSHCSATHFFDSHILSRSRPDRASCHAITATVSRCIDGCSPETDKADVCPFLAVYVAIWAVFHSSGQSLSLQTLSCQTPGIPCLFMGRRWGKFILALGVYLSSSIWPALRGVGWQAFNMQMQNLAQTYNWVINQEPWMVQRIISLVFMSDPK